MTDRIAVINSSRIIEAVRNLRQDGNNSHNIVDDKYDDTIDISLNQQKKKNHRLKKVTEIQNEIVLEEEE